MTTLPLLSQIPGVSLTADQVAALTHRIQNGGDEILKAKNGAGSATVSIAWAGAHFATQLARALDGETGVVESAFVENPAAPVRFFASPVELGVSDPAQCTPMFALCRACVHGLRFAH